MPKFKTIIFDFDGTIADTFGLVLEIINENPSKIGINGIDKFEAEKLRDMSAKYILKEFKLNIFKVPGYVIYIKRELAKRMSSIRFFDGLANVITELKNRNLQLGIITSNYVKTVTDLFTDEQEKQFDFIFSSKSLFGKHEILNRVINDYKLDKKAILYIGDETRDIEAAKKAGIKVCAVTWGFNSERVLKEHSPDYLIRTPAQILDIVL